MHSNPSSDDDDGGGPQPWRGEKIRLLIAEPPTSTAAPLRRRERTIPTASALDVASSTAAVDDRLLTIDWPLAPGGDSALARLPPVTYVGVPKDPMEGFHILEQRRAERRGVADGGDARRGSSRRRDKRADAGAAAAAVATLDDVQLLEAAAVQSTPMSTAVVPAASAEEALASVRRQPFQRRAGRPDWRAVMRLDVDEVIGDRDAAGLQSVLDTLTFSRFDAAEMNEVPGGESSDAGSRWT